MFTQRALRAGFCALGLFLLAAPQAFADPPAFEPLPPSEYVFQVANLADMSTSLDIKNHPDLQEGNPLLGRHPSDATIIGAKVGEGLLHAFITEEMLKHGVDAKTVRIWEYVSIGMQTAVVANNLALGLHFKF